MCRNFSPHYTLEKRTAGTWSHHPKMKRKIIWTKPPWLGVQNICFQGSRFFSKQWWMQFFHKWGSNPSDRSAWYCWLAQTTLLWASAGRMAKIRFFCCWISLKWRLKVDFRYPSRTTWIYWGFATWEDEHPWDLYSIHDCSGDSQCHFFLSFFRQVKEVNPY